MIHKVGDNYVISSRHVWLPGSYESERAARYAFRFSDADLQALQDSVNPGGTITFEMLQALRKRRRESKPRATVADGVVKSVTVTNPGPSGGDVNARFKIRGERDG